MRALLLAVEVLSPSSSRADRFTKRRLYQEQRNPTYWMVDVDQPQVELWTPEGLFPVVERERVVWGLLQRPPFARRLRRNSRISGSPLISTRGVTRSKIAGQSSVPRWRRAIPSTSTRS